MSKPTAKPAAAAKEEAPAAAPPKSKKMLIIGIGVLLLAVAGGAAWYFLKGRAAPADAHAEAAKAEPPLEAKFVPLGENFTVNLQHEEGDQYLQAGITLKVLQPELEEKIKTMMPEIRSKMLFLLSSKKPSELQTMAGKQKLIDEIIVQTDAVLGVPPPVFTEAPAAASGAASGAASAPVAVAASEVAAAPLPANTKGVVDVLFTSFIIQ